MSRSRALVTAAAAAVLLVSPEELRHALAASDVTVRLAGLEAERHLDAAATGAVGHVAGAAAGGGAQVAGQVSAAAGSGQDPVCSGLRGETSN